jgi:hypothetical protein
VANTQNLDFHLSKFENEFLVKKLEKIPIVYFAKRIVHLLVYALQCTTAGLIQFLIQCFSNESQHARGLPVSEF